MEISVGTESGKVGSIVFAIESVTVQHRGVAKGGPGRAFSIPSNLPVASSSAIILFARLARLMYGLLSIRTRTCAALVPFYPLYRTVSIVMN